MIRQENLPQTKQNLMEAFWNLYCEKRIEKITVKEVTQRAGYNRSTFYEYFTDIYDVLNQLEDLLIPSIEELPPIQLVGGPMGMSLEAFLELYEKNSKYYAVLLGDHGDPAFVSKLKTVLKPTLTRGILGDVEIDAVALDFALEYVLSGMIGVMSYWFRQEKVITMEKLMALMKELMEQGVVKVLRKG